MWRENLKFTYSHICWLYVWEHCSVSTVLPNLLLYVHTHYMPAVMCQVQWRTEDVTTFSPKSDKINACQWKSVLADFSFCGSNNLSPVLSSWMGQGHLINHENIKSNTTHLLLSPWIQIFTFLRPSDLLICTHSCIPNKHIWMVPTWALGMLKCRAWRCSISLC